MKPASRGWFFFDFFRWSPAECSAGSMVGVSFDTVLIFERIKIIYLLPSFGFELSFKKFEDFATFSKASF